MILTEYLDVRDTMNIYNICSMKGVSREITRYSSLFTLTD